MLLFCFVVSKASAEMQMGSPPIFHFKYPLITFSALLVIFALFPVSLLSPKFLTFLFLILSSVVFFTHKRKNQILEENSIQDDESLPSCDLNNVLEICVGRKIQAEADMGRPKKENGKDGEEGRMLEAAAVSEGDRDVDWSVPNNVGQIPAVACSDGSISDDDSLIEIALSDQQHVGLDDPKGIFWPNLLESLPESVFVRLGLMELLSEIDEINEEDNMIEIDISVGSIKCSSVEIEA